MVEPSSLTPPAPGSSLSIVNVALIGYGFAGKHIHAPLIASVPGLRLHTIVSRSLTAAVPGADAPNPLIVGADIAAGLGLDRPIRIVPEPRGAFDDHEVQLVVIATPNRVHAELARAAMASGKDVVIDKPFTVTADEARELVKLAESAGRRLSVFHNRRWDGDFLTLQRLLREERLGDMVEWQAFSDRYRPAVRDRWRERDEPGAGIWFDLGSHLVDQALHLCGAPRAVYADIGIQRPGGAVDDYFHVLLRYDTLRVWLHGSSYASANTLRWIIHGTQASFVKYGWDPQEPHLRRGGKPGEQGWGVDPSPGQLTMVEEDAPRTVTPRAEVGDFRRFYAGMRDAILRHGPVPVPPRDAVDVMRVLELGMRSAKERRELPFQAG